MNRTLLALALAFISLPTSAFAADFEYKCFSYYWNGKDNQKGTMDLVVGSNSAMANIVEESWDDDDIGGARDTKYKSRGRIEYVKFGSILIVEKVLLTGGKALDDGRLGGFVRVEGQAEGGFYQYKFVCKRSQ